MATKVEIQGVADFSKATAALDKFTTTATKGFSNINKVLVGLSGAAAAFAGALALKKIGTEVVSLVKDFAELGDNVAKTADKLGVGVEALQELRFAADRTGVNTQTLDKALQSLSRKAAEAGQGIGEAKGTFEQLGISVKTSGGQLKSTEQLLGELSNSLATIPDQGEKVRVAFKLFEAEGVGLVNTLGQGEKGLQALRQEFRDLGGVIQNDAARASEAFVDSQTNLNAALAGLRNSIATRLLPVFKNIIDAITEFIKRNKQLVSNSISLVISSFLQLGNALATIAFKALPAVATGFNLIIKTIIFVTSTLRSLIVGFFDLRVVEIIINSIVKALSSLVAALSLIPALIIKIGTLFPNVLKKIGVDINKVDKGLGDFQDGLKAVFDSDSGRILSESLKVVDKNVDALDKSVLSLGDNISDFASLASDSFDAFQKGAFNSSKATQTQIKNINDLAAATTRLTKEQEIQVRETVRKQVEAISANPTILLNPVLRQEELDKLNPQVRAAVELQLSGVEGLSGLLGGASTVVKGAAGAATILKAAVTNIVDKYLPGLGKVVGEIFEALSKSPEEVKKLIGEFFTAIPTILESVLVNIGTLLRSVFENLGPLVQGVFTGLIQGLFSIVDLLVDLPSIIVDTLLELDQLVLGIVDQVPLIIERLVTEAPRIIEALVRALPFLLIRTQALLPILAIKFVSTLIQNVPSIIEAFVKSFITEGVPEIVKGLVESFKEAFDVLGDVIRNVVPAPVKGIFGFASGGIVPGVGNSDSVPSMLTPGELVVDRSLTQRLDQFITEASLDRRLSSGNGQPQNLTINLVVGEEQLANVVVGLTQKGFRLA